MHDPSPAEQGMLQAIAHGAVIEASLNGCAHAEFHNFQVDATRRSFCNFRVGLLISFEGEVVVQETIYEAAI